MCSPQNSTKSIITLINHSDSSVSGNALYWYVRTLAAGAALMWPEHRICAAGCRAGDQDTHLPSSMAVTVPAAVMPVLALFKLLPMCSQTVATHWRGGSANTTLILWRERTNIFCKFFSVTFNISWVFQLDVFSLRYQTQMNSYCLFLLIMAPILIFTQNISYIFISTEETHTLRILLCTQVPCKPSPRPRHAFVCFMSQNRHLFTNRKEGQGTDPDVSK